MKIRSWFGRRQKDSPVEEASTSAAGPGSPPAYEDHGFGNIEKETMSEPALISDRELHWIMGTRYRSGRWQDIAAYIDPGNAVGPLVSLERVFSLGCDTADINFEKAIQITTHKGVVRTIGTVQLVYAQDKRHMALEREFHIWEEDMGRFDVCFPASDDVQGDLSFMRLGTGHLSRHEKKVSRKDISACKKRTRNRESRWWIFIEYRVNANIDQPFCLDDAYETSKLKTSREK